MRSQNRWWRLDDVNFTVKYREGDTDGMTYVAFFSFNCTAQLIYCEGWIAQLPRRIFYAWLDDAYARRLQSHVLHTEPRSTRWSCCCRYRSIYLSIIQYSDCCIVGWIEMCIRRTWDIDTVFIFFFFLFQTSKYFCILKNWCLQNESNERTAPLKS